MERRLKDWNYKFGSDTPYYGKGIPNCKTHWCGLCPHGRKSDGDAKKGKKCPTCEMGHCVNPRNIWSLGKTLRMGKFLCLNFSMCIAKGLKVMLMIKFSSMAGTWCFSIICEICVAVFQWHWACQTHGTSPPAWEDRFTSSFKTSVEPTGPSGAREVAISDWTLNLASN